MTRLRHRGFTLVELLIASTMIAVLIGALALHLRGGLSVWRRTQQGADALQRRRIALDLLERDLVNAFVYDMRQERYGEEPGQLPAPEFLEDALRVYTRASDDAGGVRIVEYRCEPEGAWRRTERTVGEARAGVAGEARPLLESCGAFLLRYGSEPTHEPGTLVWLDVWSGSPVELPRLVEVTLRSGGRTVRHLVLMPQGTLTPAAAAEGG
ncbi:MAG TPA: prepilin-type N-terminal cleavage/methylation domain-containing protein [bacterium]